MGDKDGVWTKNCLNVSFKFGRSKRFTQTAGPIVKPKEQFPPRPFAGAIPRQQIISSGILKSQTANSRTEGTGPTSNRAERCGDRERTFLRYKTSVQKFEKVLQSRQPNWTTFTVPDFKNFGTDAISHLQEQIGSLLDARQNPIKNNDFWSKGKAVIEQALVTLSPLTKNILTVAKDAISVRALLHDYNADITSYQA
jgi:hypothetical protein